MRVKAPWRFCSQLKAAVLLDLSATKRDDLDVAERTTRRQIEREVEPHAALDATGDVHPANPTCRLAAHTVL